jgi:hypothetical protein
VLACSQARPRARRSAMIEKEPCALAA